MWDTLATPTSQGDRVRVSYIHVCDYAMVSQDGKLSAMGIFSRLFANKLPAIHPAMYLAFELELLLAELDRPFEMEIQLVDEDGNRQVQAKSQANVPKSLAPPGVSSVTIPQVLGFASFPIQKHGKYTFCVFINGDLKNSVSFEAAEPPQPSQAPGLPS
jgi:hypothetical protein